MILKGGKSIFQYTYTRTNFISLKTYTNNSIHFSYFSHNRGTHPKAGPRLAEGAMQRQNAPTELLRSTEEHHIKSCTRAFLQATPQAKPKCCCINSPSGTSQRPQPHMRRRGMSSAASSSRADCPCQSDNKKQSKRVFYQSTLQTRLEVEMKKIARKLLCYNYLWSWWEEKQTVSAICTIKSVPKGYLLYSYNQERRKLLSQSCALFSG